MRLYLIRHGEAGQAVTDALRELTAEGRARTRHNAELVQPSSVATVVSSPLVRARQTAAIIHNVWGPQVPLLVDDCLVHTSSPENVARFVDGLAEDSWPLVLVGHQPLLGNLLGWLTDRRELARTVTTSSIHVVDLIAFARGGGSLARQYF